MGGDHWRDDQVADQALDRVAIEPGALEVVERRGEAAELWLRAVLAVESTTPFVVDVLGGVGEQRQPAEGPDQVQLLIDRSVGKRLGQRLQRTASAATGVDGAPAHRFDEIEHLVARLIADDVTEDSPEQADVGAEGGILADVRVRWRGGSHRRTR